MRTLSVRQRASSEKKKVAIKKINNNQLKVEIKTKQNRKNVGDVLYSTTTFLSERLPLHEGTVLPRIYIYMSIESLNGLKT